MISLLCQWKAKHAKPIMHLQVWDRSGQALAFQYQGHASNIAMRAEHKHKVVGPTITSIMFNILWFLIGKYLWTSSLGQMVVALCQFPGSIIIGMSVAVAIHANLSRQPSKLQMLILLLHFLAIVGCFLIARIPVPDVRRILGAP